jgi:hypothetical protein
MRYTYVVHIVGGGVALASGYLALYAAKGAPLHRRSGMVFVYAMLTMALAGLTIALARGVAPAINVPAALLSAYLVTTGVATVRSCATPRWLSVGLMLVALAVGLASLTFGVQAIAGPEGKRDGMPAFPFLLFGVVGTLGGVLDFRMLRSPEGSPQGASRLARHLWRMSFALFIAALSFFIGQAKVIPKPIRIPGLLALPVLAVLVTMLYWLWRVRIRKSFRGTMRVARLTPIHERT